MTSHAERYREIAETLARHGLGFLVGVIGLQRWLPFERALLGHDHREEPYTNPEHLRIALTELGPASIKLGQLLSTRSDLVPPEYQIELAQRQDHAPPAPSEVIRIIAETEVGRSTEDEFSSFDLEPLASASIRQVHAATLLDGTRAFGTSLTWKARRRGPRP
ncbi:MULTISPECIES: AarF/UbiB family protein [Bacteria]